MAADTWYEVSIPLSDFGATTTLTGFSVFNGTTSTLYFDEIKVVEEKGVVTTSFEYDAMGMRIGKSVDGTATVEYVNAGSEQVIFIEDLVGSNDVYYMYGTDLISQGGSASTSREYFLTDGMGNVRYITDSSGSIVYTFDYDPFGNLVEGSTDDANLLFQSENFDADVDLTYLRARYYDPTTGRFISQDPIAGFKDAPVSQNGYNYANNDPINLSDPSGTCPLCPLIVYSPQILGALTAFTSSAFLTSMVADDIKKENWGSLAIGALPVGGFTKVRKVEKAIEAVAKDTNKISHVFQSKHGLGPLVEKFGSPQNALNEIVRAVDSKLPTNYTGLYKEVVNVGGQAVTVTGRVIDGVVRIGTAFIKNAVR